MSTNQTRAASIVATTNCYFLTIHKEDYQAYIKRFEKKQKDQVIDFFKNVSFLKGLSNQAIIKMEYSFRLIRTKKAGEVVLREGEPVTHIALVKDGEFEIVKKNLKGIDDRILGFLHKGLVSGSRCPLRIGLRLPRTKHGLLFKLSHRQKTGSVFFYIRRIDLEFRESTRGISLGLPKPSKA